MTVFRLLAWLLVVLGVGGYVLGLRHSRVNDEAERGLVLWLTLAWAGTAVLIGSELA